MRLRRDSAANRKASSENRKASSENWKVFSEESEGFFRRALVSYTHKFPKRGAASLMYLPRLRLDLPRSHLGLPRLHLSQNSDPATEGFSNRGINFKDAYRITLIGSVIALIHSPTGHPQDYSCCQFPCRTVYGYNIPNNHSSTQRCFCKEANWKGKQSWGKKSGQPTATEGFEECQTSTC